MITDFEFSNATSIVNTWPRSITLNFTLFSIIHCLPLSFETNWEMNFCLKTGNWILTDKNPIPVVISKTSLFANLALKRKEKQQELHLLSKVYLFKM